MSEEQTILPGFDRKEVKPFSWRLYNYSQTNEKALFLQLLKELCNALEDRSGRLRHQVFCMCLKTYLGLSSRRLMSDLESCKRAGYVNKVSHFNTVLTFFNRTEMRRILTYLIEISALPLAQLEKTMAVDSTGISLHQYEIWSKIRSKHALHRKYKKAHIIYGTLTNVAASCIITQGNENDSPRFKELLRSAAANFTIEGVCADLAYSSRENLEISGSLGIMPFIPFKMNATGRSGGSPMWRKMFTYFREKPEEFLKTYHLRSNAESGFYMIKTKFGEFVKSRNDNAQINEILTKVLCHNICCLIQEMFLQNVEVDFQKAAAQHSAQSKV